MKAVMESFAQKMLLNLAYSHKARGTEEAKRVVNCTLEVLSLFMNSGQGCRLLGETQIMGRMLVDGVNLFPILQDGQQLKQLCQFYKVLATLWLQDDFIHQFERNVAQLNPVCKHIVFAEDLMAMRSDPERRKQIMQVIQMLRGIFQAATTFKNF